MSNAANALAAETRDETTVVVDTNGGGTWWPSEDATEDIATAADPDASAVAMCLQRPDRGFWKD